MLDNVDISGESSMLKHVEDIEGCWEVIEITGVPKENALFRHTSENSYKLSGWKGGGYFSNFAGILKTPGNHPESFPARCAR